MLAIEPGLRRALTAAYGPDVGRDAVVDALIWAWRHWERATSLENPGGYLYRVGQSSARRQLRRQRSWYSAWLPAPSAHWDEVDIDTDLAEALSELSERQRAAVLLVHGHAYTLAEAAHVMGCSTSTARNHADRALRKLRSALGRSRHGT